MKLPVMAIVSFLLFISPVQSQTRKSDHGKKDIELAEKLKKELNFNSQRRKGFQQHVSDKKFFDVEREKGLALFLEEQEKIDIQREKGREEYKKSKKKSLDETSPEYFSDLKEKKNQELWLEEARKTHVRTRDQLISRHNEAVNNSESAELDLYNNRPRYDLRKRYNNKWVKDSSKSTGSGSSGNPFSGGAPIPENIPDAPPPPMDFSPQPIDSFEEIPPPPSMPYDQNQGFNNGFDPSFGDAPVPPPPPPPDGWDF